MTEYERVEIMDRILLDFSETTENIILSYDTNVLDTDNETYNTNNPYIICSDITNGNKVDLTTCNFVRIYDPETKSLKTVIESHTDTCLNKDGNTIECVPLGKSGYVFDKATNSVRNDIEPLYKRYSELFYKRYNVTVPNGKVVYIEFEDRPYLLCDTTIQTINEKFFNFNTLVDTTDEREIINITTGSRISLAFKHIYDIAMNNRHCPWEWRNEKTRPHLKLIQCIQDAVNQNQIYDIDSDFVLQHIDTSGLDEYVTCKKNIEANSCIIKDEKMYIDRKEVRVPRSACIIPTSVYSYGYFVVDKKNKLVARVHTEWSESMLPVKSYIDVTIDPIYIKKASLPFTRSELTAFGIYDHWDCEFSTYIDKNVPATINALFNAIKHNNANIKTELNTYDKICSSSNPNRLIGFETIIKMGKEIGHLVVNDNVGSFHNDNVNIKFNLGHQSIGLRMFLSLFKQLTTDEINAYAESYAKKHFMQIAVTNNGNARKPDEIADDIIRVISPYSDIKPESYYMRLCGNNISFYPDKLWSEKYNSFKIGCNLYKQGLCLSYVSVNEIRGEYLHQILKSNGEFDHLNKYDDYVLDILQRNKDHNVRYIVANEFMKSNDNLTKYNDSKKQLTYLLQILENNDREIGGLRRISFDIVDTRTEKTLKYGLSDDMYNDYILTIEFDKKNNKIAIKFENVMTRKTNTYNTNGTTISSETLNTLVRQLYEMNSTI